MITPRASPLVTFESPMLQSKWLPDKLPMNNIPTVVPVRFLINLKNTQIERTFYPIICISPPEGVNIFDFTDYLGRKLSSILHDEKSA